MSQEFTSAKASSLGPCKQEEKLHEEVLLLLDNSVQGSFIVQKAFHGSRVMDGH